MSHLNDKFEIYVWITWVAIQVASYLTQYKPSNLTLKAFTKPFGRLTQLLRPRKYSKESHELSQKKIASYEVFFNYPIKVM